jgi:glutamate-5-semialdehyde dehydrogenase
MENSSNLRRMASMCKSLTSQMAVATSDQKNRALEELAKNLKKNELNILSENKKDLALARESGLNEALLERLSLENKLPGIIEDVLKVISLSDPIGEKIEEKTLENALLLGKYRTPIGVLGVIYESRPNVTVDISSLAIKSGNCAILRGGSETLHTNRALVRIIQESLSLAGLPPRAIEFIDSSSRAEVKELIQLDEFVDLIIPRGSALLQEFCRKNSTIPVIIGGVGICHLFVDETADLERSLNVILNAKVQRPTVCNSLDTVLVHSSIASKFIPKLVEVLGLEKVSFKMDQKAFEIAKSPSCSLAGSGDWDTEWLNLTLGVKVVESLEEAMDHIELHSTKHSDGILTETQENAEIFVKGVDSAVLYVNASTRFTDGSQFGLGSEVAVSTQKLHARGPMGLKDLTSYKWIVRGDYQVRG